MVSFADDGTIRAHAAAIGVPVSDPHISAAIADVQRVAASEGIPANDANSIARVTSLLDSYQQVSHNLPAGVADVTQTALSAARQYVTQNHELGGAIETTQGLIGLGATGVEAIVAGAKPGAVLSAFAGPLVAAATAAGTVSAGIGAAIVVGAMLVGEFLDSITQGMQVVETVCGVGLAWAPHIVHNCVIGDNTDGSTDPISPGSSMWRSFPLGGDAVPWYTPAPKFTWRGATWYNLKASLASMQAGPPLGLAAHSQLTGRPVSAPVNAIDAMFPEFAQIQKDAATAGALQPFAQGFMAAWKANAAFIFNGLQFASNAKVLEQFLRIWNRSHQGPAITLRPGAAYLGHTLYLTSLIQDIVRANSSDVLSADGTGITINCGLMHPAPAAKPVVPPAAPKTPITPADRALTAALLAHPSLRTSVAARPSRTRAALPWAPAALGLMSIPFLGWPYAVAGALATGGWLFKERIR